MTDPVVATSPVRCLIISHAFNMDGRAASHTVTDKLSYLLARNFQLFVLSSITGARDRRFAHAQLMPAGPSALRFDFRHWMAARFGRGAGYRIATALVSLVLMPFVAIERVLVGLSSQWSWAITAALVGYRWIRKHEIDLIYSTGGAWSAHLAGWWLHRLTGVRWVVEFHDPMVERTGPGDLGDSPRLSRDANFRRRLEALACRHAAAVWWFTEGALHYARLRNPGLGDRGFHALPGAEPPELRVAYARTAHLNIAHFGSLADSRSLAELFDALPAFFRQYPDARGVLRVHVYGAELDRRSKDAIADHRLHDTVFAHGRLERDPGTGLSGRAQIFQRMQTSDFLLLLHGNHEGCAEYIPSKIYEYWWAQRPVMAIIHRNPELDRLVQHINGTARWQGEAADKAAILKVLGEAWLYWSSADAVRFQVPPALSAEKAVDQILARILAAPHQSATN